VGLSQQIGASSLIKPGVIDNTAARPASPYEGQVIFQKDTDQLLVWNGTAWVIPNSPAQNPSGLELITDASFTAQSSVPVSGCFTSRYVNYRVIFIADTPNNSATRIIKCRLRLAGGDDTSASYVYSSLQTSLGSTTVDLGYASYSATEMDIVSHYYINQNSSFVFDIFNPQVSTKYSTIHGHARGGTAAANTQGSVGMSFATAVSHTGFSIYPSAGTITGNYYVYGYRNS